MKNNKLLAFYRGYLFKVFLLIFAMVLLNNVSEASHFRYGTITWQQVTGKTYKIKVSQSWRKSFFTGVVLGGSVPTGALSFGDGSSATINLVVTTVNNTDDWFYGEATITHTYAANGNFNVQFSDCCRIAGLNNVSSTDSELQTTIVNVGTTNNSPVSTIYPIVNVQANGIYLTDVSSIDLDGDNLTYRLSTAAEMGAPTYHVPAGVSVNAATGFLTFNTTGYAVGTKFALGIITSDGKTTISTDFILNIVPQSAPPKFDYAVTPTNAIIYKLSPGQPLNFGVKAFDTDPGSTVLLTAVGLPIGSLLTPSSPNPSNPVSSNFSWTPTSGQLGSYAIKFIAQDNATVQTFSTVNIIVSMAPVFDVPPTPAYGIELAALPGTPITFNVQASDPDPLDKVSITNVANKPATAVLTPLPSTAANPTLANFSWNPAVSDWGEREIEFEATDSYGDHAYHKIGLIVNTPPVFTSTPTTSVIVNHPYTYLITGLDPDVPYGDIVEVIGTSAPAWLTFVDNGDGTASLTGTPTIADAGTYNVTLYLEDIYHHALANGIPSQTFTITVIPCTIAKDSSVVTHVTCNALLNGTAEILFTGGFGPFTYNWSNGSTNQKLTNVGPGTYSVIITDAYNCSIADSVTITEPTALTDSITVSNYNGYGVSCVTASNGSATVFVAGGVAPYTTAWSTGASTPTITELSAGNYTVIVRDANGCTDSSSVHITAPTALTDSIFVSNYNGYGVSCAGSTNGTATVTAAGGVAPYTTAWSTGAGTPTITGLSAGNYTVIVRDANGCTDSTSVRITPPAALRDSITVSNYNGYGVSCAGSTNGTATVFIAGGVAPYTTAWSTGASTPTITGLSAGNYTVIVRDANGCTDSSSVRITAPAALRDSITVSNYNGYGVSCAGSINGTATVTAAGGVAPYTTVWSTGATTTVITGLATGNYSAVVTDGNGCKHSVTASISEPTKAITVINGLSNYSGYNVACFNGNNGFASSQTTGGIAPYTTLWSTGAGTSSITGLAAGNYSVTKTDANGCTSSALVTLTQPAKLAATITSPTVIGSYNTSCSTNGDGGATIAGTGGVNPYSILWNTGATTPTISGLLAGTYSVVLTDKNGCNVSGSGTLTKPENCNCVATPIAPTASCANCSKVLDGQSNVVLNAGDNACIVSLFVGNINMNGGNLVICGNATLQWLTIPNNSKVTVLGTLTVSGINFNGSNAALDNFGKIVVNGGLNVDGKLTNNNTITVNQTANFNSNSYVINNGTITLTYDLNNNKYFANNGTLIVGGTIYNNSNSTMLNNCTTKAKAYYVNSNVVFANNGTLNVTNDTRFNSATGTIASGSILNTQDIYLNGTTLSGAAGSCASIKASNYTQINQATLIGKIALCDANGFEIKNNLSLVSGASTSCTACQYSGSGSTLREAAEDDASADIAVNSAVSLYPNPIVNGQEVVVSSAIDVASVSIIDNTGRLVKTSSKTTIQISDLSVGMYVVKVQDILGNVTITKLLVQ